MIGPDANSFAGIGSLAFASLAGGKAAWASDLAKRDADHPWPALTGFPHHAPKAKQIVHLCVAGGPSHLESLDPKPELEKIDGQTFPDSFTAGEQLAQLQGTKLVARESFAKFKKWGESGTDISELFSHIGSIADDEDQCGKHERGRQVFQFEFFHIKIATD